MKEMSDAPGAQLVDRMIDEMLARRSAARPGGSGSGHVRSPLTADEALVSELAGLGAVDWPADDAGDRIARSVAKLASQPTANPLDRPGHRRRGRPGRRLGWVSVSVGAAAAASLVAAALFGPWLHEIPGRGAVAPATSPSHPAGQGQFSRSVMRLVESTTSPFQPVGTGDNRSTFFT